MKDFIIENGENCSCGKKHLLTIKDIIVKKDAISELPSLLKKHGGMHPFILADRNTYKAAGEKVVSVLKKANIPFSEYVFEVDQLEPDEKAVGSAVLHFDSDCDVIIGVGSGVINDVSKILANITRGFYYIVATAPSMDGYASATSSMLIDRLKVSIDSKCADVIIGDIDVLKNAPQRLLTSGLGDMLAKYISICEWRIANEILGEYYCEKVANLVRKALKKCVDNAKGLLARDEDAVKSVFDGLIIGGVAMAYAGVSRPASGVEHYISHVLDMRALEFDVKAELHGIQCAIGTLIASKIYEKLKNVVPNKEKAFLYVKDFDYTKWSEKLKEFLGAGALAMINSEKKEGKYDKLKHSKRIDVIIEKWDKILEIINEEVPPASRIEEILEEINCPKTLKQAGISCDVKMTLKATKDVRDKYVVSRLLWDLGVLDEMEV